MCAGFGVVRRVLAIPGEVLTQVFAVQIPHLVERT
jgi:hypothetical protein